MTFGTVGVECDEATSRAIVDAADEAGLTLAWRNELTAGFGGGDAGP